MQKKLPIQGSVLFGLTPNLWGGVNLLYFLQIYLQSSWRLNISYAKARIKKRLYSLASCQSHWWLAIQSKEQQVNRFGTCFVRVFGEKNNALSFSICSDCARYSHSDSHYR